MLNVICLLGILRMNMILTKQNLAVSVAPISYPSEEDLFYTISSAFCVRGWCCQSVWGQTRRSMLQEFVFSHVWISNFLLTNSANPNLYHQRIAKWSCYGVTAAVPDNLQTKGGGVAEELQCFVGEEARKGHFPKQVYPLALPCVQYSRYSSSGETGH